MPFVPCLRLTQDTSVRALKVPRNRPRQLTPVYRRDPSTALLAMFEK